MILREWNQLPSNMQNEAVKQYYTFLRHKSCSLVLKRLFDIIVSLILMLGLLPVFIVLSAAIMLDSPGNPFFLQKRVTAYGREFHIVKFRTMVVNAEKLGSQVTVNGDKRVTRVGKLLRRTRLDEITQLINIFKGDMTFVGTRPEVPQYVAAYTDEMQATLLLPAGVTSEASILYKDEAKLLSGAEEPDTVYIETVLPQKMRYNLQSLLHFSFWGDIRTMWRTCMAVCGKVYPSTIPENQNVHI